MGEVLVVDDEKTIADTLAVILRKSGIDADVAYDAKSALLLMETKSPSLLLTDVMMPGMNGIELAIEVRKRNPACKVLLFSGVAQSAHLLEDARKMGYDFELLAKPIHPADLLARLVTGKVAA
jgi:DNA-binding response OmpR family regulator